MSHSALWPSPWPAEDGGPSRRQVPDIVGAAGAGLGVMAGTPLTATSRMVLAATMVVLREPGEVYLLGHTAGDDAISWVEQIDPVTLEPVRRSADLPGGPTWPGGIAAHANGSLYVVFGRYAHRLSPSLEVLASVRLPRERPYNSFVVLPDGSLATKDFAGARPGHPEAATSGPPSHLVVLDPDTLEVRAELDLPERSIARLSADGNDVYVVGDHSLVRARWDGSHLHLDPSLRARYRTMDGQTYGWDAVIAAGAAWFLDNGEGSERFAGTFRGIGVSSAPLHLVRVDLETAEVSLHEICGLPGGLIANPPAVDVERGIAVGYDSGNGVVTAFSFDDAGVTGRLWQRSLDHAAHPLLYADTGELVLCHMETGAASEQVVIVDIETGADMARVDTGSPIQSVLFACPGWGRDLYLCSLMTVTRIAVDG
ncbi:MAG: hypothetical protein RI958_1975 [Actinomycetota bacterium]